MRPIYYTQLKYYYFIVWRSFRSTNNSNEQTYNWNENICCNTKAINCYDYRETLSSNTRWIGNGMGILLCIQWGNGNATQRHKRNGTKTKVPFLEKKNQKKEEEKYATQENSTFCVNALQTVASVEWLRSTQMIWKMEMVWQISIGGRLSLLCTRTRIGTYCTTVKTFNQIQCKRTIWNVIVIVWWARKRNEDEMAADTQIQSIECIY